MRGNEDLDTEVYRLLDSTGAVIAERVERVTGFWGRLRGLLGRRWLESGTGIWITPCSGIHTFGMRFAIDVLLPDRDMRIVRIARTLKPNRFMLPAGTSAIEI